jgi:dual specificity protein kinase YAK1
MYRNPYITPQSQNPSATASSYSLTSDTGTPAYPSQQHAQYPSNQAPVQHRLAQQQPSTGQLNMGNTVYPSHPPVAGMNTNTHLNPNLPSSSYYPSTTRARANTINQMDTIPPALAPALARLQHMNQDVIGGRNALTPVLNRDDAMREWERRQSGKPIAAQPYPQLEYLQQQAEAAAASGLTNWASSSGRYPPPPSKLSHSFHPPTITVDGENTRRDVVMSNVRSAVRNDNTNPIYGSGAMMTSPTSQTYTGNSTTASNRYANATTYPQTQQSGPATFDSRTDMGNIYVPMQPDQYQSYAAARPPSNTRHVAPPAQTMAPSFYGAGIVPSGQTNNVQQSRPPFAGADSAQPATAAPAKDTRRASGLDAWPR